jgi:hypothetical protein
MIDDNTRTHARTHPHKHTHTHTHTHTYTHKHGQFLSLDTHLGTPDDAYS